METSRDSKAPPAKLLVPPAGSEGDEGMSPVTAADDRVWRDAIPTQEREG